MAFDTTILEQVLALICKWVKHCDSLFAWFERSVCFYCSDTAIPYHNIGNMTNPQYPILGQEEIAHFKSDISIRPKLILDFIFVHSLCKERPYLTLAVTSVTYIWHQVVQSFWKFAYLAWCAKMPVIQIVRKIGKLNVELYRGLVLQVNRLGNLKIIVLHNEFEWEYLF